MVSLWPIPRPEREKLPKSLPLADRNSRCRAFSGKSVNQGVVVNPEKERDRFVGIGVPSEKGAFPKREPDRDGLSEISIENRKLPEKRVV